MASWPETLPVPDVGSGGEFYKPQIRTEKENGDIQSRPQFTGDGREIKELIFSNLTQTQFGTLKTFVNSNMGLTFDYTHPLTAATVTMRFTSNGFRFTHSGYDRYEVRIQVEEA